MKGTTVVLMNYSCVQSSSGGRGGRAVLGPGACLSCFYCTSPISCSCTDATSCFVMLISGALATTKSTELSLSLLPSHISVHSDKHVIKSFVIKYRCCVFAIASLLSTTHTGWPTISLQQQVRDVTAANQVGERARGTCCQLTFVLQPALLCTL